MTPENKINRDQWQKVIKTIVGSKPGATTTEELTKINEKIANNETLSDDEVKTLKSKAGFNVLPSQKVSVGDKSYTKYDVEPLYVQKDGTDYIDETGKRTLNPLYDTSPIRDIGAAVRRTMATPQTDNNPYSMMGRVLGSVVGGLISPNLAGKEKYKKDKAEADKKTAESMAKTEAELKLEALDTSNKVKILGVQFKGLQMQGAQQRIEAADEKSYQTGLSNSIVGITSRAQVDSDYATGGNYVKDKLELLEEHRKRYNPNSAPWTLDEAKSADLSLLLPGNVMDLGPFKVFTVKDRPWMFSAIVGADGKPIPSTAAAKDAYKQAKYDSDKVESAYSEAEKFVDNKFRFNLNDKAQVRQRISTIMTVADKLLQASAPSDQNIVVGGEKIDFSGLYKTWTFSDPKQPSPKTSTTPNPTAKTPDAVSTTPKKVTSPLALQYTNNTDDADLQLISEFTDAGDKALNDRIANESNPAQQKVLKEFKDKKEAIKGLYPTVPQISAPPSGRDANIFSYSTTLSNYITWYETINGGVVPPNPEALPPEKKSYYEAYIKAVKNRDQATTSVINDLGLTASDYTVDGKFFYAPKEARNIGAKGNTMMMSLRPLNLLRFEGAEYSTLLDTAQTILNGALAAGKDKNKRKQQLATALGNNQQAINSTLAVETSMYNELNKNGRYLLEIPNDPQRRHFYFSLINGKLEIYLSKVPR